MPIPLRNSVIHIVRQAAAHLYQAAATVKEEGDEPLAAEFRELADAVAALHLRAEEAPRRAPRRSPTTPAPKEGGQS